MPVRIPLRPNEPVTLSLLDPYADSCERYDAERGIGEYRTTDGRILALPRQACILLNELNPQPGEEIGICRSARDIRVWLTASSEKARAEAETPLESSALPSDTELLLEASLKRQDGRKRRNGHPVPIRKEPAPAETLQPRLFDRRGTGTDGPAPQPAPLPAPLPAIRPAAATGTPYGDILRHIIHTVEAALKAEGVQLGDAPKQDLYSTVYIDAARRSGVRYDFTREAE